MDHLLAALLLGAACGAWVLLQRVAGWGPRPCDGSGACGSERCARCPRGGGSPAPGARRPAQPLR